MIDRCGGCSGSLIEKYNFPYQMTYQVCSKCNKFYSHFMGKTSPNAFAAELPVPTKKRAH